MDKFEAVSLVQWSTTYYANSQLFWMIMSLLNVLRVYYPPLVSRAGGGGQKKKKIKDVIIGKSLGSLNVFMSMQWKNWLNNGGRKVKENEFGQDKGKNLVNTQSNTLKYWKGDS